MRIRIPTLTEIYPQLLQEQTMKQQTSLLTAILELHKTLQNFQPSDIKTQNELVKENNELHEHVVNLEREVKDLNDQLDAVEGQEKTAAELQREVEFHVNRFNTLQEHYKNSTSYNEELHKKVRALENQLTTCNLTAPKGFKSWEDAATTERLKHNQTKTELANKLEELATVKLKLDRFRKLFKEAMGQ